MAADLFEAAFEHTPVALYLLDGSGRLVKANAAARKLALDLDLVRESTFATLAAGKRVFAVEQRRLPSGSVIALHDVTGHPSEREAAAHDRRLEALGAMSASVAHDLRNVLTPLLAASELLEPELQRGTTPHALLGEIQTASRRALGIVNVLVRFVVRQPAKLQRVDVNTVIRELQPLMERSLPKIADLGLILADTPLEIETDRGRLETAILNLIINARDALPNGGNIRVTTSVGSTPPDASGYTHECARITVSDDGVGMPPEVLAHALDRFFTTKPADRGTGLGLVSVQSFVADSGGHLSLRSAPGAGTTAILSLPIASESSARSGQRARVDADADSDTSPGVRSRA